MSRKERSVTRFEKLVRPNKDAWTELLVEFEELFSDCDAAVVYGLPESLIDTLAEHVPSLCNDDELGFERRLSELLRRHHSVGLSHGRLIRSCLFEEREPMTVSREDVQSLGWEEYGLTPEKVNALCLEIESRAVPFREQAVAYAGWLVTNPHFLAEVAAIRERKRELVLKASDDERAYLFDREMNAFCSKWQLAGMASWDLPEPQGPNLAGMELPESARRGAEQVSLEIPLTMRLPARFPIRDLIAEIRSQAAQPHLCEWQKILSKDSEDGSGLRQFRAMLQIQFFRNVVLASRYADRFKGRVEALDRAFGRFLKLGEDSVKKLRLKIERRLGRQ